jgi:hypothetical protein
MDLGPTTIVSHHLHMPSGWIQDEPDHHLCPVCSSRAVGQAFTAPVAADEEAS